MYYCRWAEWLQITLDLIQYGMTKISLYNYLTLALCLLAISGCDPKDPVNNKLDLVNVEYTPSQEIFPNPERGFYKYSKIDLTTGTGALSANQLAAYRQNNITLLGRMIYLKKFRNTPLSQAALDEVERDFVTARNSGVKLIVRFAYSESQEEPDAPLSIIKQHLEQLKPVLERNADVIYTVQAGFIGAWGEWYYSSNNLNTAGAQAEVISKLLEAVPKSRTILLRTPAYKQQYFQRNTPLTYQEAFQETDISGLGIITIVFLPVLPTTELIKIPQRIKLF